MTNDIAIVPPRIQTKYPHMMPADITLWQRFLRLEYWDNAKYAYDVHVGTEAPNLDQLLPEFALMGRALSTKRIDVVSFLEYATFVIEVKPYAGLSAVGQAISYPLLFKRQYPHRPNVKGMIITDHAQLDIPWLCQQLKITLLEMPE